MGVPNDMFSSEHSFPELPTRCERYCGGLSNVPVCSRGHQALVIHIPQKKKHLLFTCERAKTVWTALGFGSKLKACFSSIDQAQFFFKNFYRGLLNP
jgi:hypothetical protein